MVRYLVRAPVASDRVHEAPDARVLLEIPPDRRSGAGTLVLDPLEWLRRITSHDAEGEPGHCTGARTSACTSSDTTEPTRVAAASGIGTPGGTPRSPRTRPECRGAARAARAGRDPRPGSPRASKKAREPGRGGDGAGCEGFRVDVAEGAG
jgi:hypothetical protein